MIFAAIIAIGGGFIKYGEITTKLNALQKASMKVDKVSIEMVTANEKDIGFLKQEIKELKAKEGVDISGIEEGLANFKTKAMINSKEIELLKIQIEEIIIKMILLKPTNLTLVNLMGLELQMLYLQSVIQLI